ncbi:MAG: biotin--[acetyl-CoA-carboxylase] ligase [Prevotella sp.]|jgi:BirA family biotin operon repressor/biotin-[acetyl-CoA-carboxylase] ligase
MLSIHSFFKKKKQNDIQYIHVESTNSTNDYLRNLTPVSSESSQPKMIVVSADFQTAGRGQGSNHWESEKGKNLMFSLLCHPVMLPIPSQFLISEAHALSLFDVLSKYADGFSIKWPNDIYWHDKKICGTLIETSISNGHIRDCIIGTGVNVNQTEFLSDAPNPISLKQITGQDHDPQVLLKEIVEQFEHYFECIVNGDYAEITTRYMSYLYRQKGFFKYRDRDGEFDAAIVEVEDNGHLILRDKEGCIRSYHFKEVEFL